MPHELLATYLKLPVFMLVAARLGGLLLFQPVLSALAVPAAVRVGLVLGLAALIAPLVAVPAAMPDTVLGLVLGLAGEILLGALVGLVVAIGFVGVQMGGTLIAQESGLAFGEIADPTSGGELNVLSSFYMQLAIVVYLVVGGHRAVLGACLDTFTALPLLQANTAGSQAVGIISQALAVGTAGAIRVAAPALLTLFLVNLALGFISRTVPQLNITTVGFSVKGLIGFAVMAAALPSAAAAVLDALELGVAALRATLGLE